ncbi:ABC transporter ATP-binding protein [Polynucleobacter paneuropaeus]|jgi:putrescine transport system ATP-binding protein|nr:ABC transporter ATP-binding protein [Polynucleobacter paneuropaeus]MBT8576324.1 ABC transporter ATP-binding protein [Polynucleobacter paneuropaeus]QWD01507.1 ABC transporter ATP-binding protein [Polynucleobacter paneuropaeus]
MHSEIKPLNFLKIENLKKEFGSTVAVDSISLAIPKGQIFALLGSSGCGKSTLLRMLAGFETATSGRIILDGRDISSFAPYERPINMMFQSYALFPHLNVYENIAFGLKRMGIQKSELESRVDEMLSMVKLAQYAKRKPHELSGGQQQRVALARSLARKPELLLLDEPLGALDKKLRQDTQFELVNILKNINVTCVMVTHDQDEAMTMADMIGVMSEGKILQVGNPHEVYENPNCQFVADFIGDINMISGSIVSVTNSNFAVQISESVLHAESALSLGIGQKVTIAIRPEKIFISRNINNSYSNSLKGHVKEIGYLGKSVFYLVNIGDGLSLKVMEINSERIDESRINIGDPVICQWHPSSSILFSS